MTTTTRTEEQVAIRITDFYGDYHFYQAIGPDYVPFTEETATESLIKYKPFNNATVVIRTVTTTETEWKEPATGENEISSDKPEYTGTGAAFMPHWDTEG